MQHTWYYRKFCLTSLDHCCSLLKLLDDIWQHASRAGCTIHAIAADTKQLSLTDPSRIVQYVPAVELALRSVHIQYSFWVLAYIFDM